MIIHRLDARAIRELRPQLATLLLDAVADGHTLGFLAGLDEAQRERATLLGCLDVRPPAFECDRGELRRDIDELYFPCRRLTRMAVEHRERTQHPAMLGDDGR